MGVFGMIASTKVQRKTINGANYWQDILDNNDDCIRDSQDDCK